MNPLPSGALDRLAASWKPLLVASVVGVVAITVIGPNHLELQQAGDADEFRRHVSPAGRHLVAAVLDIGFAVAYGLLGVAVLRAIGARGPLALLAGAAIVTGALADLIENVFLVANIARHDTVTDGWITAMRVPGTVKWVATPGALLALGLLIVHLVGRRRSATEAH